MEATGAAGAVPVDNTGTLLRRLLRAEAAGSTPLALADVLWYFGAISGVAAAIAIVDEIPESHHDLWEFLASLAFLAAFAIVAWPLTRKAGRLPGGLAVGMAAAMVPAVGYGFTQLVHAYPGQSDFNPFVTFSGATFAIALATAAASLGAYLLTGVASNLAVGVLAFLLASQFLASSWHPSMTGRATTALLTGSLLVVIAVLLDAVRRRSAAFWPYAGGLTAVTTAFVLYAYPTRHLGVWIAMLALGTALVLLFPFVRRRTWAVFGAANLVGALAVAQVASDGRGARAIAVGVVVTGAALLLDAAERRREAFWLYVGGLTALAQGLIYLAVRSPQYEPWIPMLVVGATLLAMFIWAGRKTWLVFGALGVAGAYATAYVVSSDGRAGRALVVAIVVFSIGLAADVRGQRLTGFWLQLGGLLGIAAALIYLAVRSPAAEGRAWIPMLVAGAVLLLAAAPFQRRIWVVFGAAGVAAAFGHYLVTQSSWFRYALLAVAIVVFAAGVLVNRARSTRTGSDGLGVAPPSDTAV